jgi:hypothetical protein
MPAKSPPITPQITQQLLVLGQSIRRRRKELEVSATVAAESASMSRVTWHRIEKGEPAVTMGAYLNAMAVLGLNFAITHAGEEAQGNKAGWIPARIRLADYPQLKQLAWHVQGTGELSAREALDLYERNMRHLNPDAMTPDERQLLTALRAAFGETPT